MTQRRTMDPRPILAAALVGAALVIGACTSPGSAATASPKASDQMMEESPKASDQMMEESPRASDQMMEESPSP